MNETGPLLNAAAFFPLYVKCPAFLIPPMLDASLSPVIEANYVGLPLGFIGGGRSISPEALVRD
jgi:hypothetical protein